MVLALGKEKKACWLQHTCCHWRQWGEQLQWRARDASHKTSRNELMISTASNTLIEYSIIGSNCAKQKWIRSDIRKGRVKWKLFKIKANCAYLRQTERLQKEKGSLILCHEAKKDRKVWNISYRENSSKALRICFWGGKKCWNFFFYSTI